MNKVSSFATSILAGLRNVVGDAGGALHSPEFLGNEWLYLKECLDTTYVSSVGRFVDRFEADIAAYTGAKHAIAVVNGTAALHTALLMAGVKPGDEVLMPALTFVATANAISYCGAYPHFIDCEEVTLGIDTIRLYEYLKENTVQLNGNCINKSTGRVVRALVPMHTFGHPSDIDGILKLAADFNLLLIEDAAEALGSYYHGKHVGTFGMVGVLSFNGNKIITTGGGGALLTNNSDLARRAKHITTTAKLPHAWEYQHDEVGFNYRLPNINAALGCAQLENLPNFIKKKRKLYQRYQSAFADIVGVKLLSEPPGCVSNYWLQTLILDSRYASERDVLLEQSHAIGISTRPVWNLLHRLPPFVSMPRMDLSRAENIERRVINIPSSAVLALESE